MRLKVALRARAPSMVVSAIRRAGPAKAGRHGGYAPTFRSKVALRARAPRSWCPPSGGLVRLKPDATTARTPTDLSEEARCVREPLRRGCRLQADWSG